MLMFKPAVKEHRTVFILVMNNSPHLQSQPKGQQCKYKNLFLKSKLGNVSSDFGIEEKQQFKKIDQIKMSRRE